MRSLLAVAALALCACGANPHPGAGSSRGAVPDLFGIPVMVLPVQATRWLTGDATAELVYALRTRGQAMRWLMPDTLRSRLARTPTMDVPLETMPVGIFLRTQVDRLGDPMFGYLRRLNALTGGKVALIPVEARYRPATAERPGAVEFVAALVSTESGRVGWFGVVEGEPGEASSGRALASAADALARRILRQP
ncbi:MAG: hypothetical protein EXR95_05995 [Gemmatimonadetes bacterium]|nr:hypothetical protein [Gemmatimonadota bacterium]